MKHILEALKCFPVPNLESKCVNLYFRFYIHAYFPESRSGKHFQVSGMRAIDSPHQITHRNIKLPLEK